MYDLKCKRFVRGIFPKGTKEVKQRNMASLSFTVSQLKYISFLGVKNVRSVCNIMEIKGTEINAPLN